jgi:serine/threonine-protein kinase
MHVQTSEVDVPAGLQVGEYIIEGKIGEGGFGSVYRASHPMIGKLAAVKVLARKYSSDPEIVSRFAAEARAVNQIRHRNIIDIFAFGQLDDGRSYYVMELLDGQPLDQVLADTGGIPLSEALPILRDIARALDAAHAKGIAHRDLKPENVFLARDSDGELQPKLLDFGIAKLLGDQASMHKTRTGSPIGTPYYMSPEQCRGQNVDHRTDVYSFGCVAYQVLTGMRPFDGDNHLDIMMKQTMEEPLPPSQRAAENPVLPPLSPAVDDAIAWCMRKDPAARPDSVMSAVRAFEAAAGVPPTRDSIPLPTSPTPSRLTPMPRQTPVQGTTALAQTIAATGEQDVPKRQEAPRPRAKLPWLAASVLVVAVGVTTFVLMRSNERAKPVAPARVEAPTDEPVGTKVEGTSDETTDQLPPAPAEDTPVADGSATPVATPPKPVLKRPVTKPKPKPAQPAAEPAPVNDPYARH